MSQILPDSGYQFWNSTPILTLAPGTSLQEVIQFDGASWYDVYRMTYFAQGADTANALIVPEVTLQISDTGSNEVWMQQPILLGAIGGRGDLPHVFIRPRRIAPRQQVRFNLANLSASSYTLQIAFSGLRYRREPAAQ